MNCATSAVMLGPASEASRRTIRAARALHSAWNEASLAHASMTAHKGFIEA